MTQTYPVQFNGHIDPDLSRWMWLIKWFLAIPHYIVLAFLWLAFGVATVIAGFAVLFTNRYPRSLFDFNVGVMRWTWRVTFYSAVLGTDKYPPFSLSDDANYPAGLNVDYPEQLSRGLVLVKWWLLAIPHYLVVGVFGGGFVWTALGNSGDEMNSTLGGGLIGLLALISGVTLLFTHRYPRALFDFIMGMERWTYRVIAYAALMRDEYPPFRLDTGETDSSVPATNAPTPDTGTGLAPA